MWVASLVNTRLAARWLRLSRDTYRVLALKSIAREARVWGKTRCCCVYISNIFSTWEQGLIEQLLRVRHTLQLEQV